MGWASWWSRCWQKATSSLTARRSDARPRSQTRGRGTQRPVIRALTPVNDAIVPSTFTGCGA